MDKKEKFTHFLESLKGNGQDELIETVKTGFNACYESLLGLSMAAKTAEKFDKKIKAAKELKDSSKKKEAIAEIKEELKKLNLKDNDEFVKKVNKELKDCC